ncbi:MAG: hypothetical protein KGD59_01090 [Candidatus Heimdallarchaeota archaeon]|nr:hypothetical protein [Candidatus Heimdallarchaeota archaeon]MBY8993114.1 hypothetical protein [Candidatus Heimdallarchaeota archaeon]
MEKNKKIALIIGVLIFALSGGVFTLFYSGNITSMSSWGTVSVAGVIVLFIAIGISITRKKRSEQSQDIKITTEFESIAYKKSKHYNCFWCGYPLEKQGEFCSDCGKKLLRCTVCKLPISFGDTIGKCSLCESIGHFTHLFEWVKTKGSCPHCLQHLPTQAILAVTEVK